MSADLRRLLESAANSARPLPGFDDVWRRSRRVRTHRVLSFVAGISLLIVAGGAVTSALVEEREGQPPVRPAPTIGVLSGSWRPMPPAPINPIRLDVVSAWTGEEFVVWGGYRPTDEGRDRDDRLDGAAYDPTTDAWRAVPTSPLETSDGRAAVWTGEEFIIWGGEDGDGSHEPPDAGAAYDPVRDSWRGLSPAPGWSLAGHSALWTGDEMIVWGGVDMQSEGAVYNPRDDEWRALPPAPIDGRVRHSAVWTGDEMIVWGGHGSGELNVGAAYNPASDTWQTLPPAPIEGTDMPVATWTGKEVIVWGGCCTDGGYRVGAAYDPATNSWRKIADAPGTGDLSGNAVWTGEHMIVQTGLELAAYSPSDDEWLQLPEPPSGLGAYALLTWTGEDLIVWGGAPWDPSGGGAPVQAVFTPD